MIKVIECFCTDVHLEANESFPLLYIKACVTSWHETQALCDVLCKREPNAAGVAHSGRENELASLHFSLIFE